MQHVSCVLGIEGYAKQKACSAAGIASLRLLTSNFAEHRGSREAQGVEVSGSSCS